jgi:hypothetical protein
MDSRLAIAIEAVKRDRIVYRVQCTCYADYVALSAEACGTGLEAELLERIKFEVPRFGTPEADAELAARVGPRGMARVRRYRFPPGVVDSARVSPGALIDSRTGEPVPVGLARPWISIAKR